MYKSLIKPLFFLFPPERAHHLTMSLLKAVLAVPGIGHLFRGSFRLNDQRLERSLFGLTFPNPVGLAAGFDKDGRYMLAMNSLGFGFLELGTVTPRPQPGNSRPRLFRLPSDQALINRMGFNNEGVDALVNRLKKRRPKNVILGGNIGKNKTTPNERAEEDYVYCFERLHPYVDYFVVNVSSPNTPDLRALQDKEPLERLLSRLQELNRSLVESRPILLKIAPDLTDGQLDDIIGIVQNTGIDGVIATNTTISREGLQTPSEEVAEMGNGGLSGRPLRDRATEVIRYLTEKSNGSLPVIGVGGIAGPDDAQEKLDAGAGLVQIYSGLVYEGPGLVKRIKKYLLRAEK